MERKEAKKDDPKEKEKERASRKAKRGSPTRARTKGPGGPAQVPPGMEATDPNELPGRAIALGWVHQALDEGPGGGAYEDGRPVEGSP